MNIVHTAGREIGQIYIPFVNWSLALATLAAVIGFGSSDALAGAYGIAVSLLMAITTPKLHPDQGGSTYLAARINEAKDVLLGPK